MAEANLCWIGVFRLITRFFMDEFFVQKAEGIRYKRQGIRHKAKGKSGGFGLWPRLIYAGCRIGVRHDKVLATSPNVFFIRGYRGN